MRIIMVYPWIMELLGVKLKYSILKIFALQMLHFKIPYSTQIIYYFIPTGQLPRVLFLLLLIHFMDGLLIVIMFQYSFFHFPNFQL